MPYFLIFQLFIMATSFSYGTDSNISNFVILNPTRVTNIEPQILKHLKQIDLNDWQLQEVFNKDFSPFIKYFETNQLYPYITMNNIDLALTNKYGLVFINNRQLVLNLKEIDRLAKGTTFQKAYHLIHTNYDRTLEIYEHISNVYFAANLGAWTDKGVQFFTLADTDRENIRMDEIPYNFFTLWERIKEDSPNRFRSFEHFIYTFTAIIGKSSIVKEPNSEKRRYYFLSIYYPVDQSDRFHNAILNFMVYKCWVYGGLTEFNPY